MASITIRNLEADLKRRLRVRAAEQSRSMEEEAREILRLVVGEGAPPRDLAAAIRARVAPLGGVPYANRCANRHASDARVDDHSRHQRHLRTPAPGARAHEAAAATRNTGDYAGCGIEVIDPWLQARSR